MVPFADLVDRLRPLLTKWSVAWREWWGWPARVSRTICSAVRWHTPPLPMSALANWSAGQRGPCRPGASPGDGCARSRL